MKIINRFSGEKKDLPIMNSEDRSVWLMKKVIRGFDRCVKEKGLFMTFLSITQSNKSLEDGYRWITSVMAAMKGKFDRRNEFMLYVAVLEIQPKRYKKFGVLAPHWHIAIGTSVEGGLPHAEKDAQTNRIKKVRDGKVISWDWLNKNVNQKFGMYFPCDCYSKQQVYDYLAKYLAKGDLLREFRENVGKRVRVFSSSRLKVEYFLSCQQKSEYAHLLDVQPDFKDLYMRRNGSKIDFCSKEIIEVVQYDGKSSLRMSYRVLHKIKSDWVKDVGENLEETRLQKTSLMVSG